MNYSFEIELLVRDCTDPSMVWLISKIQVMKNDTDKLEGWISDREGAALEIHTGPG